MKQLFDKEFFQQVIIMIIKTLAVAVLILVAKDLTGAIEGLAPLIFGVLLLGKSL